MAKAVVMKALAIICVWVSGMGFGNIENMAHMMANIFQNGGLAYLVAATLALFPLILAFGLYSGAGQTSHEKQRETDSTRISELQ